MPSILITGASGFIGSFIVEEALTQGFEVWAAVRSTSSRQYLTDARIRFITLSLGDEAALRREVADHVAAHGPWQYVVHAAGATKCLSKADFFRTNTEGTERLARVLTESGALKGRMVFISSLSVMGAPHEGSKQAITERDTPHPNTAYGKSKLEAEQRLAAIAGLDYVVLRPTGVYGPRERDYFLMAKSICRHIDTSVGLRPQRLTFIYVLDLVQAVFVALTRGERGDVFHLSDGRAYSQRAYSDLLQKALGVRGVWHLRLPLWVLRVACFAGETMAHVTHKPSTLNNDKYHIMKQRNWRCDISHAESVLGYRPRYTLALGVSESVAWYKKAQWL